MTSTFSNIHAPDRLLLERFGGKGAGAWRLEFQAGMNFPIEWNFFVCPASPLHGNPLGWPEPPCVQSHDVQLQDAGGLCWK